MAARMGLNGSQCITPVLFSMEMERVLGPINMVPIGFKGGAIDFAGLSGGYPKRQPLVRIDGAKPSAEYIYRSAAAGKDNSDAFFKNVEVLDAFMDDKIGLPGETKVGKRALPKEMTVRQLAAVARKNLKPEIAKVIRYAYDQTVTKTGANQNELQVAKDLFNSAVLAFAISGDHMPKTNPANLLLASARELFRGERYMPAAIAADYAQDIFGTLHSPKASRKAGLLAFDAWFRSMEEFQDAKDWPGFLIAIRYGLLSAMKTGDFPAMAQFNYRAARYYETMHGRAFAETAADYRLRAAISVLQKGKLSVKDWGQVDEHLHRARKVIEERLPLNDAHKTKEKIRALSALRRIAEEMSGK